MRARQKFIKRGRKGFETIYSVRNTYLSVMFVLVDDAQCQIFCVNILNTVNVLLVLLVYLIYLYVTILAVIGMLKT